MKKSLGFFLLACLLTFSFSVNVFAGSLSLLYNFGGSDDNLYTPEAYYAAPIIKDINKDGRQEIIFGNYSIIVLDAQTGNIIWRANGGKDISSGFSVGADMGRINKIAVEDIDGDSYEEIVAAHTQGTLTVLSYDGYMKPGFPKKLNTEAAVNSISVNDIDNDGKKEIIAAAGTTTSENVWVMRFNGEIMPGWPQLSADQDGRLMDGQTVQGGYSYGVFMDGVTSGDINGDGLKEIIVATDTPYICAYDIYGRLLPANQGVFNGRSWGKVALWEDYSKETMKDNHNNNQGWGSGAYSSMTRADLYRVEFGHGVTRTADVDNNGTNEVIVSGIMVDRYNDAQGGGTFTTTKYMFPVILNGDRTRYPGWEQIPSDLNFMGAPLIQDPATLSSYVQAEPVIADLNNDGVNELIINTYDGKVHAFSVNNPRAEYGNFPYTLPHGDSVETANGVVCQDINGDGTKEVIFTSNTRTASGAQASRKGSLYVLNSDGSLYASSLLPDGYLIYETQLPAYTNGSLSAPAVADVDGDGKFEVAVNTEFSGVCLFRVD